MSEFESVQAIPEEAAHIAIANAVAAGAAAQPAEANGAIIEKLTNAFGPFVQKVISLIKQGMNNLPAIIAALQAAGITLPGWAGIVIQILIAIVPVVAAEPAQA